MTTDGSVRLPQTLKKVLRYPAVMTIEELNTQIRPLMITCRQGDDGEDESDNESEASQGNEESRIKFQITENEGKVQSANSIVDHSLSLSACQPVENNSNLQLDYYIKGEKIAHEKTLYSCKKGGTLEIQVRLAKNDQIEDTATEEPEYKFQERLEILLQLLSIISDDESVNHKITAKMERQLQQHLIVARLISAH